MCTGPWIFAKADRLSRKCGCQEQAKEHWIRRAKTWALSQTCLLGVLWTRPVSVSIKQRHLHEPPPMAGSRVGRKPKWDNMKAGWKRQTSQMWTDSLTSLSNIWLWCLIFKLVNGLISHGRRKWQGWATTPRPSSDGVLSYSPASHQRQISQLPLVSATWPWFRLCRKPLLYYAPVTARGPEELSPISEVATPCFQGEDQRELSAGLIPSPVHQLEGRGRVVIALHSVTHSCTGFTEGPLCD